MNAPTNLPCKVSSFVGRQSEVLDLQKATRQHRLVTLLGSGGCGKTRLALQVGKTEVERYSDGVWLVELAGLRQPEDVAGATARVLGLREEAERSLQETLARSLQPLKIMLVLDNCEHLLASCAQLVALLARSAPGLHFLATSREALGLDGEITWHVPSLDSDTAVALFVERGRQVQPAFDPGEDTRSTIELVVERLDGLPLAIELAAARIRMMHPSRILASLDDRFHLLTDGNRTALPRQQTLEASVLWSYELLTADERILAQRLSVLHTFDIEAAEAVGNGNATDQPSKVLDLLTRLVDQSLVLAEPAKEDTRYSFLETIRQFLLDRLVESETASRIREQHLQHYLLLAEALAPRLALGDGPACLARLEAEHDNLNDALAWAESSQNPTLFLRLCTALTLYFELRGHLAHGGRCFARARILVDQALADTLDPVLRARASWGAAHVAFYGGRYEDASVRADEALTIARACGDRWAEARALNTQGVMQSLSTPSLARESLSRSIELGRAIGDDWAVADGWKMMTVADYTEHEDVGGQAPLEALRQAGERLESRFFLAWYEAMVGYFARDRGDYELAGCAFDRSLAHCNHVGDPSTGGFAECWSAALEADLGRVDRARERLQRLLAEAEAKGSELAVPEALFALASIENAEGRATVAVDLLTPHIESLCSMGVPIWAAQALIALAAARRLLDEFQAAEDALANASTQVSALGNPCVNALILFERGLLALANEHVREAEGHWHAALTLQIDNELVPGAVRTLEALAGAASHGESDAESTRILAAADAQRKRLGMKRNAPERRAHDRTLEKLVDRLGEKDFRVHWTEANALSLSDIVEYTQRARGERKRPSSGWESLTPTERRVTALVAEGLTNPQIGERMFIATGTAKVHVAHIFTKLAISRRAQLAAMAAAHGNKMGAPEE